MWLRLRQIALVAHKLAPIAQDMHDVFGLEVGLRDTGGSFLEIDFQKGGEDINGPWEPAGKDFHKAIRTEVVRGIAAAEIQSPDPKDLAERWSRIVEIPLKPDKAGNPSIRLENATIRFV